MEKRLAFGAIFLLGTLVAAVGWLAMSASPIQWLRYLIPGKTANALAIGGHLLQIFGVFGAMLVPDGEVDELQNEVHTDE